MAILSTGTSGISMFSIENYRKKMAVILESIYQLPQNLARVCNLVGSFDLIEIIKIKNFSIFHIVSIVFYCFAIVCFVPTLILH